MDASAHSESGGAMGTYGWLERKAARGIADALVAPGASGALVIPAQAEPRCLVRERWGTFSVRDHICEAPFVTEVLLYDRLIIPVPDPADPLADKFWDDQKWQPKALRECLSLLKIKTEKDDGLALAVPWDSSKRERFKSRMSVATALATQHRKPGQDYYMDPFEMTRKLLKDEFRPALPPGVSKAWSVAAYHSAEAFRDDIADPVSGHRARLAFKLSHQFLTPSRSDPKHELLKRAIELATTDDFRRKRQRFYEWQENIIEENISDEKAVEEMEQLLSDYNQATEKAFGEVIAKYAFTVITIGLATAGAMVDASGIGLILAGTAGVVELTRFWKFERKPQIDAGDVDAAAMVHDARKSLPLD